MVGFVFSYSSISADQINVSLSKLLFNVLCAFTLHVSFLLVTFVCSLLACASASLSSATSAGLDGVTSEQGPAGLQESANVVTFFRMTSHFVWYEHSVVDKTCLVVDTDSTLFQTTEHGCE